MTLATAVTRLASTVTCGVCVVLPKDPTLPLTVARVVALDPMAWLRRPRMPGGEPQPAFPDVMLDAGDGNVGQ